MGWSIPDTYTPYGDPDTVYWDDPDDDWDGEEDEERL